MARSQAQRDAIHRAAHKNAFCPACGILMRQSNIPRHKGKARCLRQQVTVSFASLPRLAQIAHLRDEHGDTTVDIFVDLDHRIARHAWAHRVQTNG